MNSGTYSPNFFGFSVTHDEDDSRRVFGNLSGIYANKQNTWKNTSDQDKDIYLVERHELAHHNLFSSTPCGLLLWRLNEVINRDIQWAEEKAKAYGVTAPQYSIPRTFYQSKDFEETLTLKGCPSRIISYLIDIYKNIENCLIIRDIFFGANSHRQNEYRSMTLENLTCRLNIAFKWMSERCDLPWTKKWKIKGDPNGLVFSTEKSINCHDIAEAHAVAHELMAIRAFGDKECFTQRLNKVLESSYKIGIEIGRKGLQKINGFEFSPLLLLHRGLLAFCTCIDLTVAEDYNGDLFIEDHLPWLQFEQIDIFSGSFHSVAAQALNLLNTKHIYQNGSNWGCLKKFNDIDNTDLQTIYNNMVWLGMDLQVHAFHRNSKTNRSYIVDYLSNKDFAYDQVNKKLIDNNYLIEYSNSLIYYCMDLPKVYGGQWSELMAIGFGQLNNSIMQLFCHLLNGAQKRNTIARFLREQVPNPDIIANKLNNSIHKQCSEMEIKEDEANQIANRASKILKRLIENGKFGESGEAGFLVNNHGRFII